MLPAELVRFVPDPATVALVGPLALLVSWGAALLAGWLRVQRGVRVAYTRKLFHLITISAALCVHLAFGLGGVSVFGGVAALLVLGAVAQGDGFAIYEALARPSDAPRRSLFVVVPLATTALGGVLANLLFSAFAHVGYLVVAWGDAVGEPVGARFGRHRSRVPSIGGVAATRSLEGCFAVMLVSTLAGLLALLAGGVAPAEAVRAALPIGLAAAGVEALSHHGLDNLTLQLAGAGVAAWRVG